MSEKGTPIIVSVVVGIYRRLTRNFKRRISSAVVYEGRDGTRTTSTQLARAVMQSWKEPKKAGTKTGNESILVQSDIDSLKQQQTELPSTPPQTSVSSSKVLTRREKLDRVRKKHHKTHVLQVIHRDGYVCSSCGVDGRRVKLTLDHVKPLSEGGSNKLDNLQLLCSPCHRHKDHLSENAKRRENVDRIEYLLMSDDEKELIYKRRRANTKRKYLLKKLGSLRKDDPRRNSIELKLKELEI